MRLTIELDRRQAHHLITALEGGLGDHLEGGLRITEAASGEVVVVGVNREEEHPLAAVTLYPNGAK